MPLVTHNSNNSLILINELPINDIEALKLKYEHFNLHFIRGNYVHEDVLFKANVDEIIVRGEHLGSLIVSATSYPGLPKVFSNILSPEGSSKIKRITIPIQFIGKTFGDFERFIKESKEGILIGLMKEKESMKLEYMLSDDTSVIEKFIKEKIQESKLNSSKILPSNRCAGYLPT